MPFTTRASRYLKAWQLPGRGDGKCHTTISTKEISEIVWRSLSISLASMLETITTEKHVVNYYNSETAHWAGREAFPLTWIGP